MGSCGVEVERSSSDQKITAVVQTLAACVSMSLGKTLTKDPIWLGASVQQQSVCLCMEEVRKVYAISHR